MKGDGKKWIIGEIEKFFYRMYWSEECRLCRGRIRCNENQFIKREGRVQCSHCKRHLETI